MKRILSRTNLCLFGLFALLFSVAGCQEQKQVTYSYLAEEGGTIFGESVQKIFEGEVTKPVFAEANEGYRFTGWDDGLKSDKRMDTALDSDATFTATFEKIVLTTYTYVAEEGGELYGKTTQVGEPGDTLDPVYVVPKEGYRFTGWDDGITTLQRMDVLGEESKTFTAKFSPIKYVTYRYATEEGGDLFGKSTQTGEVGETLDPVHVAPKEGYRFAGWDDGVKTLQRADVLGAEDKTFTAKFTSINYVTYQYATEEGGELYGKTTQTGGVGDLLDPVYVVPKEGYRFAGWDDGLQTLQRTDTLGGENKTLTAKFSAIKYVTYSYASGDGGDIYGKTAQTGEPGDALDPVHVAPKDGYRFVGWDDGVETLQRMDVLGEENKTFTALFEKIHYVVYQYYVEQGGSIQGLANQKSEEGEWLSSVYAVPDDGYRFVRWDDGNTNPQRMDKAGSSDRTIKAIFEELQIYFYSEGNLVRQLSASAFEQADKSKLIGYKSNHSFDMWTVKPGTAYAGLIPAGSDAMKWVMDNWSTVLLKGKDVCLDAVYSATNTGVYYTIAHGLGGLNDETYLETKEAFEHYYNLGQRFFEADMGLAENGDVILVHFNSFPIPSAETYMDMSTPGKTYMDIDAFVELATLYSDAVFDVDALTAFYSASGTREENCRTLLEGIKESVSVHSAMALMDRLILEIPPDDTMTMFVIAEEVLPFGSYLYAEFDGSPHPINHDLGRFEEVCAWCHDNGVSNLSIDYWMDGMGGIASQYGVRTFVYTFNDYKLMYDFLDRGVDCVFTDFCFI